MLRSRLLRYVLIIFGTLAALIVAKNAYLLYSLSHGTDEAQEIRVAILLSTFLTLALIAISAFLISRLISDRISRLLEGMQEIKKGGYPMLRVTGRDELATLTRGFNDMVEELRTRDEKLKSWAGRRETELARLSQNLEVERGKLETVLQSIGEGVIVLDNENRVLMANRRVAEIFNITPEELSGTDLRTLISHVRHRLLNGEKFDQKFEELQRQTDMGEELVLQLDEPNGPEIRLYCTPVRGVSGKLFGRIATSLDMSRERELERLKTEFISTISHELRTPLTSINGALGLIRTGAAGSISADMRELLDIAVSNTERLVNTINNMLDIGQLERGQMRMNTIAMTLPTALDPALRVVKRHADQRRVKIEAQVPSDLPGVMADPRRIEQVLINLLSNAIKFSQPDGQIIVKAAAQDAEVVVSVQDFGTGISEDFLQRLFDKFEHEQGALTRASQGAGLGLAICKQIVTALGGKIWVKSEPGQGSTFYFSIPQAEQEVIRARAAWNSADRGRRQRRLILVIEDDEDAAKVISYVFEAQGHHVITCANGKEALQLAQRHHPELITLDLGIPGMNGLDVLKAMRADPEMQKVPVVCISAQPEPTVAMELGADFYLEKPVDIDRLREITEKAFASGLRGTAAWR
jgi:PAS domain S-box-containing protein